jgi:ubiquinone/menaquinone biosynthesis C-methylase UbiE
MKPETLALLRDPVTHDALDLETASGRRGRPQEVLINPKTGRRFPIRDGIPLFLPEGGVSGSNRRYQTLYDRIAPFYDLSTRFFAWWKGMSVETRLREYLDELEIAEGSLVLEVSVGTGRNWQFLPRGAAYFGLDISWRMLQQCRRNVARWKLRSALFWGAAEQLPFRDNAFDAVFHFGGINFFNDKAAAVREMIRVAKPGAKFVIGDENEELAKKYERLPVTGEFYGRRETAISAPVVLLPAGMQEANVKTIAGGDLYCLTFRKPGS